MSVVYQLVKFPKRLADARSMDLRAIRPVPGRTALVCERDDKGLVVDQNVDKEKREAAKQQAPRS
jgi:hypothetical protein